MEAQIYSADFGVRCSAPLWACLDRVNPPYYYSNCFSTRSPQLMIDLSVGLRERKKLPWLPTSSSSTSLNREFATSKTRPNGLPPPRSWRAISASSAVLPAGLLLLALTMVVAARMHLKNGEASRSRRSQLDSYCVAESNFQRTPAKIASDKNSAHRERRRIARRCRPFRSPRATAAVRG
jgi:hypothetical protein